MYGQTQTYKQIQSFGLSTQPNGDDFVSRNSFPRYSANGNFDHLKNIGLNTSNNPLDTITTFGSPGTATDKWSGGALDPTGRYIYCAPRNATTILKIDTFTDTITTFGNITGTGKYLGICLAPNGLFYCAPLGTFGVLVINPANDTTFTFGSFSGYAGVTVGSNGLLYFTPLSATRILVVNPNDNTHEFLGSLTGNLSSLSYKNHIYFSPNGATTLTRLDLNTNQITTLVAGIGATFAGCVLSKEGNIYYIPFSSNVIIKYNTSTGTASTFGSFGTSTQKYVGGCLGSDGFIYAMPYGTTGAGNAVTSVLKINTSNDTVTQFGTYSGGTTSFFQGSVLSKNGFVYGVPYYGQSIAKVNISVTTQIDANFPVNRTFNKL